MKPINRLNKYSDISIGLFSGKNETTHQECDTKQSYLGLYLVVTYAAIGKNKWQSHVTIYHT